MADGRFPDLIFGYLAAEHENEMVSVALHKPLIDQFEIVDRMIRACLNVLRLDTNEAVMTMQLYNFVHYQLFASFTNLMRLHLSEALSCERKAIDASFTAYAEYDETLRIDAVNKDISKITSAILETAAGGSEAMNSIVQLAGIKTAEVPKGRTISADTQLILSTLSGFEKRLVEMERRDDLFPVTQTLSALARGSSKHSRDEFLTLSNGQRVRRGDILFHKGSAAGELLDWNLLSGQIGIKRPDGLNELVSMNSREFHELSLTAL